MFWMSDPGIKTMPRIRRPHLAAFLLAVQSQSVHSDFRAPEMFPKAGPQVFCFAFETLGCGDIASQPRQLANTLLRGIHIGLYFAERDGRFSQRSVLMKDRIARILPALLDEAVIRLAGVLDESVAIDVAIFVDPCQRAKNIRPQLRDQI